MTRINTSEHDSQVALFYWMWLNRAKHPALATGFAIPNGGHRHIAVARKLKAEGVKAGVPDIFIPWPVAGSQWPNGKGKAGMFVEMKSEKGKATPEQIAYIAQLNDAGYMAMVCHSWQEAAGEICTYLGIDPRTCGLQI